MRWNWARGFVFGKSSWYYSSLLLAIVTSAAISCDSLVGPTRTSDGKPSRYVNDNTFCDPFVDPACVLRRPDSFLREEFEREMYRLFLHSHSDCQKIGQSANRKLNSDKVRVWDSEVREEGLILGGDYHRAHNFVEYDEPISPTNEDHYDQVHVYTGPGTLTVLERFRHENAHDAGFGLTDDSEASAVARRCAS